MDTLKTLLFEDPMAIYCAAGFAVLVLLFLWWRTRSPRVGMSCLIPPLVALAVGLTAHWVVTDREKINASLRELAQAAVNGQLRIAAGLIDDAYNDGRYNKLTLLAAVAVFNRSEQVDGVRLAILGIEVDGQSAVARFRARLMKGEAFLGDTLWQVRWICRNGTWRVIGSKLEEPAGVPMAPGAS